MTIQRLAAVIYSGEQDRNTRSFNVRLKTRPQIEQRPQWPFQQRLPRPYFAEKLHHQVFGRAAFIEPHMHGVFLTRNFRLVFPSSLEL